MANDAFIREYVKNPTKKRLRNGLSRNELQCWFYKLLKSFFSEIYGYDLSSYPIPPVAGDGKSVDLLKLFSLVKDHGGYDAVSKEGLWDKITVECGHGSMYSIMTKCFYIKYLAALVLWLNRVVYSGAGGVEYVGDEGLPELGLEFKEFLMVMNEFKSKCDAKTIEEMDCGVCEKDAFVIVDDDEKLEMDPVISVDSEKFKRLKTNGSACEKDVVVIDDEGKLEPDSVRSVDAEKVKTLGTDGENSEGVDVNLTVDSTKGITIDVDESKKCDDGDVDKGAMELDSDSRITNNSSGERNRKSMLKMLNWVVGVAKNPCDPLVVPLPESSTYKELWKQVLKVRERLSSLRRPGELSMKESSLKKNQRRYRCIYDDDSGVGYNLRERSNCTKKSDQSKSSSQSSAPVTKESDSGIEGPAEDTSSAEKSILELPVTNHVPRGKRFQVEVPEWSGLVSESDAKWIGTRVWPQENINRRLIIEREPIGKGRQDSCGCQLPKSVECVRFHISERKPKIKLEIGPAFNHWRFDNMGDEVASAWKKAEEKKFNFLMKSRASSLADLWSEKIKPFPTKTREDLVSYYYNVYMLQRRAKQNRDDPDNIDSGDEEEVAEDASANGSDKRRKSVG